MISIRYYLDLRHRAIGNTKIALQKNICYMKYPTLLLLYLFSCSRGPEPFLYGIDKCAACHKTIQNTRYGGELITVKGKVLKFDSIECLLKYYKEHAITGERYTWILVTDYNKPGVLINANGAIFIKQVDSKDRPESNLIAVSKMEYSSSYLKKYPKTRGMYWKEVVWKYYISLKKQGV